MIQHKTFQQFWFNAAVSLRDTQSMLFTNLFTRKKVLCLLERVSKFETIFQSIQIATTALSKVSKLKMRSQKQKTKSNNSTRLIIKYFNSSCSTRLYLKNNPSLIFEKIIWKYKILFSNRSSTPFTTIFENIKKLVY